MRLLKFLFTITSIFVAASSVFSSSNEENTSTATTFEIIENYRERKNIMFSAMFGGSSHIVWVLEILEQLSSRGHSTFYVTRDDHVKFANNYPSITVHSIGPGRSHELTKEVIQDLTDKPPIQGMEHLLNQIISSFAEEYTKVRNFIDSNDIDIGVCDTFNSPCVEACLTAGIPFILTSSFPQGKDAGAPYINSDLINFQNPTTEFMSLKDRLHDMCIKPLQFMLLFRKIIARQNQLLMSLGITPAMKPDERWTDSIKLVNSAFGFEQGRPVGPLVELIGPILPKVYPGLTSEIQQFLDNHKCAVFGAFGQHAWPTEADGHLIMTALLESLEAGDIDGIVWATRGIKDMFPAYVTTSSNTTYDIQGFYNNDDEKSKVKGPILFLDWAPQVAILNHPSTTMFITHGGAGSLYESMHAGVRVVVFPFFGDQPGASITSEKNGIGLRLDCKKSQEEANKVISRVARDEDGKFQTSVNRFKALVQIRSKNGATRGADIVEEVLFMHVDGGKIPHRYDVRRNISFIKANNLDIYASLLVLVACMGYGVWILVSYIIVLASTATNMRYHEKKLKSH